MHVKELSLGIYSGYCLFWQRSGHEVENVLLQLFTLLGRSSVETLVINLDAYGAAIIPCLQSHYLPPTIQHLTLSNQTQHNLDFVLPCLPNLISLKLRATSSTGTKIATTLEPIVSGGILPKLTHLEVDRADQLIAFRKCALPSLHTLSIIALCSVSLEDVVVDFLASLNPTPPFVSSVYTKHRVAPPSIQHLSLRVTCKSTVAPNPSMIYYGLLMHPAVVASRSLEHLRTLRLVHDTFPSDGSRDDAFGSFFPTLENLETFVWDVRDPGIREVQCLEEDILEKLMGEQPVSLLTQAMSDLGMNERKVCTKRAKSKLTTIVLQAHYVTVKHPMAKNWRNTYTRETDPYLSEDERWWNLTSDIVEGMW